MAFAVRDEDAGDTNVGTVAPIAPNTSFSSRDCGGHKFNEKCVELQYHISKGDFFHFGGNSLRRVHVFLRHPEKTYHPFFGPEMGVLTLFSKKRPKRPKKIFKQREEKKFFTSVYLAK